MDRPVLSARPAARPLCISTQTAGSSSRRRAARHDRSNRTAQCVDSVQVSESAAQPPARKDRSTAPAPAAPPSSGSPAETAGPRTVHGPSGVDAGAAHQRLETLMKNAVQVNASDLHIHSGSPIKLRVAGKFTDADDTILVPSEAEGILLASMDPDQRRRFEAQGELDYAYTMPEIGRFRANAYRHHRGVSGVFRLIPPRVPTLSDLGLPSSLAKLVNYHQGLVLVTGPAGCGKSSTLAAFVDILNEERRDHIISIEDPIEHLHPSKRCIVNQRQVNRHTESFSRALRAALREDPDMIVIGEMRDRETMSLALTAAETGHLVIGTLHTNSAIRTINRILGVFPPNQQAQIRTMISESLRAIVSQRLVPTKKGDRRVPALEILIVNKAVANLIRESKTFQIRSILQTGVSHGMCLLENSLTDLVKAGTITREEALLNCEDAKRLAA